MKGTLGPAPPQIPHCISRPERHNLFPREKASRLTQIQTINALKNALLSSPYALLKALQRLYSAQFPPLYTNRILYSLSHSSYCFCCTFWNTFGRGEKCWYSFRWFVRMRSSETQIRISDGKMDSNTMSGPLVPHSGSLKERERSTSKMHKHFDLGNVGLRVLCLACSAVAMASMANNKGSGTVTLFGSNLPLYAKWSYSDSFEFLVGAAAAVGAHSLLQLLLCGMKMVKRQSTIPSRNHAWLLFAGDQVFAYGMLAAGSAAAGVTNLNRIGIHHSDLPNLCKPLHTFCNKATISIAFAFISSIILGTSAVMDVFWLSKN